MGHRCPNLGYISQSQDTHKKRKLTDDKKQKIPQSFILTLGMCFLTYELVNSKFICLQIIKTVVRSRFPSQTPVLLKGCSEFRVQPKD